MVTRLELMRICAQFEEFSEDDFTPEELEEYCAYALGLEQPLSPAEWKARYFEFYDDVKHHTLKKQDW